MGAGRAILLAMGAGGAELVHWWLEPEADEHTENCGGAEPGKDAEKEPERVAPVRVVPVRRGSLATTSEVLGSVVARPGSVVGVSVPSEVLVGRVSVMKGQAVKAGDALLAVEPSAEARLQLDLARSAADSAARLHEAAKARRALNLGTSQELLQAEEAAKEAQMRLARLESARPAADGIVRASMDGLVADLHVQAGALAPAQTVLVELVGPEGLAAQLGVAPADAGRLKAGDAIGLSVLEGSGTAGEVKGAVVLVGAGPNPATHLTDVLVGFPAGALPLGAMVRGIITRTVADVLLVPRAGVLPHDGGYRVFLVKEGHAVETAVDVGAQNNQLVEVHGKGDGAGVHEGDLVVILGNYELEDGMAVAVESAR